MEVLRQQFMFLDIAPFNRFIYKKCRYNPIISAIYYYGGNIGPLLSNDLFIYAAEPMPGSLLNLKNFPVRDETELLDECGINICFDMDSGRLHAQIKELLLQGKPICCPIDMYYRDPRYKWSAPFLSGHVLHDVLIIGINESNREYMIIDTNEKDCYHSVIGFTELELCYQGFLEHKLGDAPIGYVQKKEDFFAERFTFAVNKEIWINNLQQHWDYIIGGLGNINYSFSCFMKMLSGEPEYEPDLNDVFLYQYIYKNMKAVQIYQTDFFLGGQEELAAYQHSIVMNSKILQSLLIKLMKKNEENVFKRIENIYKKIAQAEMDYYNDLHTLINL